MKFKLLHVTFLVLLFNTLSSYGQAFSATYDFASVTTGSGTTDPTTVPSATGVTFGSFSSSFGTNPNANTRFSFQGWDTGATNGSDVFSGAINTGKYYQVTITPASGYTLDINSITFTSQRSTTGPRQYAVRSSLDYTTNLPASISPANANLSVVATNIFQTLDSSSSAQNGSTITLDASYDVLSGATTFRFYGWNAEAAGGSFGIDNVIFNGVATGSGNSITTDTGLTGSPFCVGNGVTASVSVPFTISGTFTGANVFTAQLSNAAGSFASPTNIGTITQTTAGTISATIPDTTPAGIGYRIRVIGNTPATTGSNNNVNLVVNNFAAPTAFTSTCGDVSSSATWTNPGCFDEVMVVATSGSFTAALPSGTAYTANLAFGSGTAFDGGTVVYKGTGTASGTITNLTNGTAYTFKIYVRLGATWLAGSTQTCTPANICLTEGFAAGATAPSGWTFTNIGGTYTTVGNYGAATPSVEMNATADVIETPTVFNAQQLSFWFKGQGTDAASALLVEGYNGSAWVTIENITASIPTTGTTKLYNSSSTPALPANMQKFRFTYTKSAGNLAFDDLTVYCGVPPACVTPNAPGAISFGTTTTTAIDGTFVASGSATADNYLVIRSTSATLSSNPTNGTTYNIGDSVGGGTVIDNDSNTSFSNTSLTPGTRYYFFIFALDAGCAGGPQYSATASTNNTITLPNVPPTFTEGCSTNTTQVLSWTAPADGYDGYLLVVREAGIPNAVTTIVASSQPFNLNYTAAPTYNATTSRVLYIGTGTSVTVTGLTQGINYTFALHAYKNNGASTEYSAATTTSQTMGVLPVSSASSAPGNTTGTISWANPVCYQGVIAVVTTAPGITFTPSGSGASYPANSAYTAPNQVVYNGTSSLVTITGLTNGTTYYIEIFIFNGTEWSAGVEVSVTPNDVTVFNAGELLFVGYDGQILGSGAEDEYLIATMVDIKPGTQFSIVNSRYEAGAAFNQRTDKWGGGGNVAEEAPYVALISYIGTTNIPAGSVLAIRTDGSSNWFGSIEVISGVATTATTTNRTAEFTGSLVSGPTSTPNISVTGTDPDQIYLVQGSFVSDGTIDANQANYILTGKLLHGLTNRAPWVIFPNACSGASTGGSTRESRLPSALTCFNVESVSATARNAYYENDKQHGVATIRQIVNAVANVATNWTLGDTGYTRAPNTIASNRAGRTFQIGPSNPAGSWVGDVSGDANNWFNCGNWEGLKVPDSTTDVILNGFSVNDAIVDITAAYSDDYNNLATANNLSITTRKVQVQATTANILEVHGDLSISGTGALDMDDSSSATADGILKLSGDWTNSVGDAAFSEGNGTVEFVGTTPQVISSVAAEGTEIFYNVILDNDFDTAVSNDLIASGDLTIKANRDVSIDSNGYIKAYKKLDHSGNLTIENNGQFIQVDEADANLGTYTGTAFQVKRNASVNKNDYVYWSSPTIGFDVSNILTNGYRFIWNTAFVNTNGTQGNWNTAPAGAMTRGKGYAIAVPNTSPVRPASAAILTTTFTGKPNNGQFTVPIYRGNYSGADYDADLTNTTNVVTTKYDDNWNLVGNPYPSAISAEKFLDLNASAIGSNNVTISGTVWIWKHGQAPTSTTNPFYTNFVLNYYTTDYIKYNKMGATDTDFAGEIASGQGFMVNMKEGTGTLLSAGANTNLDVYESTIMFNNTLRSTATTYTPYDNSDFYKSSLENVGPLEGRHRIWLDIINNPSGQTDTSLLGYAADASLEVDNMYDAIFVPRGEVNLYSVINSNPYIIQGRPLPFDVNDLVPMGINIVSSGSHTVAIRKVDGMFATDVNIYIEDKLLNIIHDLKQSPYVFTAEKGIFNDRFVLRYTNGTLGNPTFETLDSSVVVASNHGLLTIKSYIQTLDEVTVYDILGRQLFHQKGIGNTDFSTSNISLSQQSVIVKIKLESGTIVTKKVLL